MIKEEVSRYSLKKTKYYSGLMPFYASFLR
jgi:hypothetical protein